jgi:hypothetical protein
MAQSRKHNWIRTPSGKWRIGHRPGTDSTFSPQQAIAKELPTPNGPTSERLTIQPLEGLDALEAKYAEALADGKALQNRLNE